MKDIAPELLERLQKAFQKKFSNNVNIRRLNRSLDQGKATYEEANNFALEIGDMLASVFQENLSEKDLPDGRMYYNIAKRVVEPTLVQNYELTSAYCLAVQEELNKQAGLSLKAQKPALNQDRINGIVNRLSEEEHFEDAKWLLDEPVVNFSQSVVDEAIKTNAKFQYNAGLSPRVVRKSSGKCCDWCNNLVGTYRYPDEVPDDVWRRHRYCRCTVEYDPGDGKSQNVFNKQWRELDEDDNKEKRKEASRADENMSKVREMALKMNVDYKEVSKHKGKKLTEEEIIEKVGGLDQTGGSCASLAYCYAGNKAGYDVLDFRGGDSWKVFSDGRTASIILDIPGVKGWSEKDISDLKAANRLLQKMDPDKEYILFTGKHAAIVRKEDTGYQYLELQNESKNNGFKPLNDMKLRKRFKAQKSHTVFGLKFEASSELIDVDSLGKSEEFKKLLGFINTDEANQLKGVGGSVK